MATRPRSAAAVRAPAARPARRLEPRPYATDAHPQAPAAYPQERRRERRGGRRALIGLLLGLLFAAAVVIALLISTSASPTVVNIRTTVSHDANSAINSLSNFISQYTK
jgi:ferric-dicitrate binding protein FerR (iron transport regulator)